MMLQSDVQVNLQSKEKAKNQGEISYLKKIKKDIIKNKYVYIMAIPFVLYFIIFEYIPMYGIIIAFKDFRPSLGIIGSPWVGITNFTDFFNSYYFVRVVTNTFLLSFNGLLWGFPAPIILALLINEVGNQRFKRFVQTATYLPHFISVVVVAGIIINFTAKNGIINDLIALLGGERKNLLLMPEWFRTIYISSDIWQHVGWGTIIYLAALTSIDTQLYEACVIDGGNRWRQTLNVTLPGIMPTIVILLILNIGKLMSVGFEKVFLLYNPATYQTADIISTYVYRKGLLEASYSASTAINLINTVISFTLLILANNLSRKVNDTSLW